jgi:hypothetical protein
MLLQQEQELTTILPTAIKQVTIIDTVTRLRLNNWMQLQTQLMKVAGQQRNVVRFSSLPHLKVFNFN